MTKTAPIHLHGTTAKIHLEPMVKTPKAAPDLATLAPMAIVGLFAFLSALYIAVDRLADYAAANLPV